MDSRRFDALSRSLATSSSRRGLLAGIGAAVLGARGVSAQLDCPIPGQTRNRKGQCLCPAGTDPCSDGCVDRKRDPLNCGSCGIVCPDTAICRKGECRCANGARPCDGVCPDFENDSNNCGACGRECGSGTICVGGSCQPGGPCFDAGCGGCDTCATTTDGFLCLEGAGISCLPLYACDSTDDCLAFGFGFTHCFTSDSGFGNVCVPAGEGRCGTVFGFCAP